MLGKGLAGRGNVFNMNPKARWLFKINSEVRWGSGVMHFLPCKAEMADCLPGWLFFAFVRVKLALPYLGQSVMGNPWHRKAKGHKCAKAGQAGNSWHRKAEEHNCSENWTGGEPTEIG